jgi:hypothetical protein
MNNVTVNYTKGSIPRASHFGKIMQMGVIASIARDRLKTMKIIDEATCYINFDDVDVLKCAYEVSKLISSTLSLKVLFRFNGIEIIVDKNTTFDNVLKQYTNGLKKYNNFLANRDFNYYLNDVNWSNLNEIREYLDCNIVGVINVINQNNKNLLAEKLINKYYEETNENTYVKTRLNQIAYHNK